MHDSQADRGIFIRHDMCDTDASACRPLCAEQPGEVIRTNEVHPRVESFNGDMSQLRLDEL
jgi:hypothetical protein